MLWFWKKNSKPKILTDYFLLFIMNQQQQKSYSRKSQNQHLNYFYPIIFNFINLYSNTNFYVTYPSVFGLVVIYYALKFPFISLIILHKIFSLIIHIGLFF